MKSQEGRASKEKLHLTLLLRAHGSGSILDLFSFRSDPYRSRMDATHMDPIQSSANAKRGFILRTGKTCI